MKGKGRVIWFDLRDPIRGREKSDWRQGLGETTEGPGSQVQKIVKKQRGATGCW